MSLWLHHCANAPFLLTYTGHKSNQIFIISNILQNKKTIWHEKFTKMSSKQRHFKRIYLPFSDIFIKRWTNPWTKVAEKAKELFCRNLRLRSVSFSSFFLGLLLVFATFFFDDSLSRTYWSLEFELIFSLVTCCWLCTLFVLIISVSYVSTSEYSLFA